MFPSLTMATAMEYVEEVRRSNGGSLSGLPVTEIEGRVRELLGEVQGSCYKCTEEHFYDYKKCITFVMDLVREI